MMIVTVTAASNAHIFLGKPQECLVQRGTARVPGLPGLARIKTYPENHWLLVLVMLVTCTWHLQAPLNFACQQGMNHVTWSLDIIGYYWFMDVYGGCFYTLYKPLKITTPKRGIMEPELEMLSVHNSDWFNHFIPIMVKSSDFDEWNPWIICGWWSYFCRCFCWFNPHLKPATLHETYPGMALRLFWAAGTTASLPLGNPLRMLVFDDLEVPNNKNWLFIVRGSNLHNLLIIRMINY